MIDMHAVELSRAVWRKSSRSQGQGQNCVEAAYVGGCVAIRDSKNPDGQVLVFDSGQWRNLLRGLKVVKRDDM